MQKDKTLKNSMITINGVEASFIIISNGLIMENKKVDCSIMIHNFVRKLSQNFDKICINTNIRMLSEKSEFENMYIVKYNKHYSNLMLTTELGIDGIDYEIFPIFKSSKCAIDFIKTITTDEMSEFIVQSMVAKSI